MDSEMRRFFFLVSQEREQSWKLSLAGVFTLCGEGWGSYRKKACVHGFMSILHETFAETVLATEDTWMAGRSQPHKAASRP